MRFDLKKPCKDCPFIKGNSFEQSLSRQRVSLILEDIKDNKTFPCHKHQSPEQNCAGSALFVRKQGIPNSMLQIAERLGLGNPSKLSLRKETELYETEKQMIGAYK